MKSLFQLLKIFFYDLRGTFQLCRQNEVTFLSAGVAFFGIFSMTPLLILSSIASRLIMRSIDSDAATVQLNTAVNSIIPAFDPKISTGLLHLLNQSPALSFFNLLLLMWAAYELFRSLNYAFERLSGSDEKRSPYWGMLVALLAFIIVSALTTLLLFLSSSELTRLKAALDPHFSKWSQGQFEFLIATLSLCSLVGGITAILKLMPKDTIGWIPAGMGSFLFLILFAIGHIAFTTYGNQYMLLNKPFYGPFVTLFMICVWNYYVCFVFLFSAQYAIYLECHKPD